jgi:DEAD/DEAH box helicase domain-containing protein
VFVFSSATIGKPGELASALCGLPVTEVTDDGSPRGERFFALWNPPLLEPSGLADVDLRHRARASAHGETAGLVTELVASGHRTIAFCRSRKGTEVVAADVRRRLPASLQHTVRSYRGGYLGSERREIEAELFAGRLNGVVATNALELGVDIGGLDACVLNGFPGTIASMWQQAGRAGRERQQSLAVLVAGEDQLDQWLMTHPHEVFHRPPEPAVINPSNPFVLHPHLACAAFELPLSHADEAYWPELLDDGVRELVARDQLVIRARPRRGEQPGPRAVWAGRGWPAHGVGLRTGSSIEYRIALEDGTLVGTVDESRAFEMVHPGALYLHQGQGFRVVDLDLADRAAIVVPTDAAEHTVARTDTAIRILRVDAARTVGLARLALGEVEVMSQVVGYQRKDSFSGEVLGTEVLDLPPTRLVTRAFWYVIEHRVLARSGIAPDAAPGTLHAAEHAGIGILPLFTICDRWDVGGVSTVHQQDTGAPTIVIYDGYPGGAGIAELGYAAADRHLGATLEVIDACPCADGCPSCVQSPKCGNWNEPLDKAGARTLLRAVLGYS